MEFVISFVSVMFFTLVAFIIWTAHQRRLKKMEYQMTCKHNWVRVFERPDDTRPYAHICAPYDFLIYASDPARTVIFPQTDNEKVIIRILVDLGYMEHTQEKCSCGSPCCSGYVGEWGYRISYKGKKRAEKLKEKMNDK